MLNSHRDNALPLRSHSHCNADHLDCSAAQISSIRIIKEAMREASFLYAELVTMGAPMGFCDVGGGLAVDYEVDFLVLKAAITRLMVADAHSMEAEEDSPRI